MLLFHVSIHDSLNFDLGVLSSLDAEFKNNHNSDILFLNLVLTEFFQIQCKACLFKSQTEDSAWTALANFRLWLAEFMLDQQEDSFRDP